MLLALLVLLATIIVCLAGAIGVMLAWHALRIRSLYAIPVRPLLVATAVEQIPPDLAGFLAQVVPTLHELGFVTVASVHAPQMLETVAWTQVLFVRQDRGDRASVMLLRPNVALTAMALAASPPVLIFATELPDGRSVKTSTHDPASSPPAPAPPLSSSSPPQPTTLHDRIITLYDRHRADVDRTLGPGAHGLFPEPGSEIVWLRQRAGAIAESLAEHCRFIPTADAESFRPPWSLALRAAWAATWARSTRPRSLGFEVAPPPAAPSSQNSR